MKKTFANYAVGIVGAACLIVGGFGLAVIKTAQASAEAVYEQDWSLVLNVRTGDEFNDFVLDRGMSLGDCWQAAEQTSFYETTASNVKVALSYGCERRPING